MKRIFIMWPDILISGFVTMLGTTLPALPFVRSLSLAGLLVLGLHILYHGGPVSPVRQAYLLYFTVNSFGFWIFPASTYHLLTRFPASTLYASLLTVAIIPSLVGGRYFTSYFAKKSTPSAVWETEVFKAINRNMSWMWSGMFAAALIAASVPGLFLPEAGWLLAIAFQVVLPAVLMLGMGVRLNHKYPTYYQRRMSIKNNLIAADSAGSAMPIRPNPICDSSSSAMSCQELIKAMPGRFNREAAGDLKAVFQFKMSGTEFFDGYLVIADGRCTYTVGVHAKPDVIILSPAEVWLEISKGQMNGQVAFMLGKYHIEGDLSLLTKLGGLFSQVI